MKRCRPRGEWLVEMPGAQNGFPTPERRRWWRRWWLPPLAAFLAFLTVPGWYHLKYRRRRNALLALCEIGKVSFDMGERPAKPWFVSLSEHDVSWTGWPMREIDLSGRPVDDAVFATMFTHFEHISEMPDSLRVLNLSGTRITDAGFAHARSLTQLQGLGLSRTQITDAGLANIEGMTRLTSLGLSHTRLTGSGLVYLKGMTELRYLFLSGTPLTDAGLAHIKGLPKLQSLHLNGTRITDAGLAHLRTIPRLQHLDLRDTPVTDVGLAHLKGMPELGYVNVSGTGVTEEGAESLKMSLRPGAGVCR
ncbi:MAG: leucine-rich repeat domain-containing protein [Planctomycetota bacterium]